MAKVEMPTGSIPRSTDKANTEALKNTPVTGTSEAPENPAVDPQTNETIVQPPAPGAEMIHTTKDIASGASLAGATKGSPQTIDPTPQGTPAPVISDPSAPPPQAESTLSQTDRDPDPGTDQPGLNPNVPERLDPNVTVNTANPDPWPEGEVPIEEEVDQLDQKAYTYRHKTIRNYRVHKFFFENHLMTIFGEEERDEFIALWKKLPIEEKNQIVEYHPEKVAQLESAVDAPRTRVVTGVAGSGLYPENRTGGTNTQGQKTAIDQMKTKHS